MNNLLIFFNKKVIFWFGFLLSNIINNCYSQSSLLLDPNGAGGFELGSSFADNGWAVSNGANNPWTMGYVNAPLPFAGNSAYISSDFLVPGYSNTASASNFFWRDITVSSGEERVNVTFNWLSGGESVYDLWQVFFVPVTTTPFGTTTYPGNGSSTIPSSLNGAFFVGSGNLQSSIIQTFNGSVFLSAGVYRIVFHWKNDGGGGTAPGAFVDNISITSQPTTSFVSLANGNWSASTTWGGAVPSAADNVVISPGHTVVIDAVGQGAQSISIFGTLNFGSIPSEFQSKDMIVESSGLVNVFSGTTAKTLRVSGNLVNNGRINTLASSTVNGTLNLNGSSQQTISGMGVWGGTIFSSSSTNQIGVVGSLTITNTSLSIPRVNYIMGGTLRVRGILTLTGSLNLNGSTLIRGNYASGGSLTIVDNGGVYNGTYGHWWTTSSTGTSIFASIDPTASTSLYPLLSSDGISIRRCWISRSNSLSTGNTAGEILVTHTLGNIRVSGNAFTDVSYNISDYWEGTWTISTASGYVYSSGSHSFSAIAPSLFAPSSSSTRLMVNGGSFVGNHQAGTGTPGAQRTGLTTSQLTNPNGFVMGINSIDICSASVPSINENFDTYVTGNIVPFCWNRIVIGSASQTISGNLPASGTRNIYQSSSPGNVSYVVLPQTTDMLSVSTGTFRLKFKTRNSSSTSPLGQLTIGYFPSSSLLPSSFLTIININVNYFTYGTETVVLIPAGIPANSRLAIANLGFNSESILWDDLVYESIPICIPANTFSVNSISFNSARITWNTSPSSNSYELFLQPRGLGNLPTSGTLINGNFFIATGLLPGVEYEYYLRTICPSSFSQWQGPYFFQTQGISLSTVNSCIGDTVSSTIRHTDLVHVANASLRLLFNPDSLVYVGFNSLNPAFVGMSVNEINGVITMDWSSSSNQTIAAGNMMNLRFRVNGNSNLSWDTLIVPSEFYDSAYNLVPQTFSSGSINHRTIRLVWNRNICQGQSFTLGNQSYTTSGTYQGRRFGTGGACDTLITLNLNVLPRQTNSSVTVCSYQPYSFNGVQLNASGVYLDTLVNILGCDSIVQLNFTVNPAYNQNLAMTICAGGSLQFGSQNLTVAGNYTNTFVSSRGCDSLVNLSLNVSNSTTIVSSNGQNGFCPNGSVRIGLANPQPTAIYTWRKDGIIIPNASSDTLSVNQTGNYQLAVQVSPNCIIQSNTLAIGILNCNRITGDLRYDNNNQSPLAGIPVHLKTLLGNIVASDTTDSAGVYDIAGYSNGNYLLDAVIIYIWGGVNSTDALQVTRFFTSLVTLSPLRIKVGDVNGSGITNSGDALLINRRITGLIPSFSVGNFVNNLPSVNALGNPLMANLRALSTGDVNGTYNPQPTAPTLVLDTVIAGFGSGTATVRFTLSGSGVFERGVCWSTSPNPTVSGNKMVVGSGGYGFTQVFSGSMVGNQIHYARAYARTSTGIFYSNEKTFIPVPGQPCPGVSTVTDIDGNVYQGIQIGTQCWTQSNLKVSKYRNGDSIPTGLSNSDWHNTTSGAYAIYNNDPVNDGLYGKLYNHYAVTDSRGLCPTGWHVPSDWEWTFLENHLGGSIVAGGALKSTSTQPTPGGWASPNVGATNSSLFTALPGGLRGGDGGFGFMASHGYWWSSSVLSGSNALYRYLYIPTSSVGRYDFERTFGFSVRCLRD